MTLPGGIDTKTAVGGTGLALAAGFLVKKLLGGQGAEKVFATLDKDGDGVISADEAPAVSHSQRHASFHIYVSPSLFLSHCAFVTLCGCKLFVQGVGNAMTYLDKDGDGKISKAEFLAG